VNGWNEIIMFRLTFNEKNKEKVIEEMAKCTPLCANCHRELHYTMGRNADAINT
jgi:predicted HNH restriction endonuclease